MGPKKRKVTVATNEKKVKNMVTTTLNQTVELSVAEASGFRFGVGSLVVVHLPIGL